MIRSTFASFVTAQSGLAASQRALDVVGQNMTNANKTGYTRQRLDQISMTSGGYTNRYSFRPSKEVGQGVMITGISQIRDPFLDVRFRRECTNLSESDAKLSVLEDLASVFDETTFAGLGKQISEFISQLQELSKNAGDKDFDSIVRSSAQTLCTLFNALGKQIDTIRENTVYQLHEVDVGRANTILESLASLNKSIREDQTYGNPALELLDERNLLLDELSQYMKINVKYTPKELAPGIIVEDVDISLVSDTSPATYTPLVSNNQFGQFKASTDTNSKSVISFTDWKGTPTSTRDVTSLFTSGSFKGMLDQLNMSGEFDTPANSTRGIGFYSGMLDPLAAAFANAFNDANAYLNPAYDPANPTAAPQFFYDRPLFENIDTHGTGGITARNIATSQAWMSGAYGVTTSKNELPGDNSGARDNVLYMISLFEKEFDFATPGGVPLFSGTFQKFFRQAGNILALDTQATERLVDNYAASVDNVATLRENVSAVNLDEEGINLLRYQKSYNAAARFMTTLDEALDKIINGMGIVGR